MDTRSLELHDTKEGCRLRLRVSPGASRDAIVGPHGGALKVTVGAAPERGKANEAVAALLAAALAIPPSRIRVSAGHASRSKTLIVAGLSADQVRERLAPL